MRLTPSKQRIWQAISDFWKKWSYSPTFEEIMEATGLRSTATVSKHVNDLIAAGCLARTASRSRSLVPLPLGKGDWIPCDEGHRIILHLPPACDLCREKQATAATMRKVNGQ